MKVDLQKPEDKDGKNIQNVASNVNKLAFIDSLRGVAILMVILIHSAQSVPSLTASVKQLTEYGQMGVQLFFVLSAYTICLSLDKRKNEARPILFFYIRRYFRIAPLYYCGILLYFTLNLALGESGNVYNYTFKNVFANVFFYHGFYPPANNNIVYGGWSIGAEMAFYVIAPFLFLGFQKITKNKFAILLIPFIGCLLSYTSFLFLKSIDSGLQVGIGTFFYYNILNQLPIFLLGISYYFWEKSSLYQENKSITVLIFVGSIFLSLYLFFMGANFTLIPFLSGLSFVFLLKIFQHNKLVNFRILRRIGQLSFSIYIFHFLFAWWGSEYLIKHLPQNMISPVINLIICFILTLLMTGILAVISEKTVERTGIKIGKYLISRI